MPMLHNVAKINKLSNTLLSTSIASDVAVAVAVAVGVPVGVAVAVPVPVAVAVLASERSIVRDAVPINGFKTDVYNNGINIKLGFSTPLPAKATGIGTASSNTNFINA